MLSHFWTANEDARLRREQIHDWLDDLGAFASSIVASAVTEWRQTQSKRPVPADIRTICLRLEREAKEDRERHRPLPASRQIEAIPPSPDTVRDNWRQISWLELSQAEQDLFRQENEARHREAPRPAVRLPVIPPGAALRPAYETASVTPERLAQLMRMLPERG